MRKLTLEEVIALAEEIVNRFDSYGKTDPLKTCLPARDAIELLRNIIERE